MTAFAPSDTRGEAVARLRRALERAGIEGEALDARLLAEAALGIGAAALIAHPELPIGPEGAERLGAFARRRIDREPVARILGTREFWGLPFELSAATLEPRPDTETVVEAALAARPDRAAPLRILDLGTGSGCILVALLGERPRARGLGVDRSPAALATARANAVRNGVRARAAFAASDWAAALSGRFDLVVSNPPYIAEPDLAGLAPEVSRHDPRAALDGGRDGLWAYRAILPDLQRLLAPGGVAVLEIGHDQAGALAGLAAEHRLALRRVVHDLGGRDRAVVLAAGEVSQSLPTNAGRDLAHGSLARVTEPAGERAYERSRVAGPPELPHTVGTRTAPSAGARSRRDDPTPKVRGPG